MITIEERQLLRSLARQVADIAALPVMEERRNEWRRHNRLQPGRPMILVFPEGAWCELLPWSSLVCKNEAARLIEYSLRQRIYTFEHFDTDNVIEADWVVSKVIHNTGWGLDARHRPSTTARGSWAFDPVLKDPADFKKLRVPTVTYDEEATARNVETARELFGDILEVKLRGTGHLAFHLMALYSGWRGLEQAMFDMADDPNMVHDAMAFLEEGHNSIIRQYVAQNLLSVNNDNTYHSSGGVGYTDELPGAGYQPEQVRPCDIWASAESQEMTQVSPAMHQEFTMQYEQRLLAPFGLNGYGCCDDLTHKLETVLQIPKMRRISIAPSANVDRCAERLERRAIFSWKPDPTLVAAELDPRRLRGYLAHTLDAARGCALEIILKDTHTCQAHPERFDTWCETARELVNSSWPADPCLIQAGKT